MENHLEKAMANYEELRQVEKDHREMVDQFLTSAKEARTLFEPGTNGSPSTEATTISKVKGNGPGVSLCLPHEDTGHP